LSEDRPLFVARESDVAALHTLWATAREGQSKALRLQAPFGGGRRALSAEFLRQAAAKEEDTIIWRVNCLDQENGLQWLVRMYGSLVAVLTGDVLRRGKVEMVLNAQLPGQPKRVQSWYQQFIAAMKEAKTDAEKGQVQLRMPQDNPLVGLVEVVAAISRKIPMIIEIQNPYAVNSLNLAMFVEALFVETQSGAKLLQVLFDEAPSEVTRELFPMPLLDLYDRMEGRFDVHAIEPWGATETTAYLDSKGLSGDAARLSEIATGRPGFIAELAEILDEQGRLGGDLSDVTLASLVPGGVDEDELEVPDSPPEEGKAKHASADDSSRVMHLAALLGAAFPSNLVADMGGYDRDSIDDLLDAMGDLFEEVQFSQELNTWIYRFKRGCYREGVLEHNDTDEGHDLARRVGVFMEQYLVPRGYGFIVKTARVYAEHGAPMRARLMRAQALSNDNPDVWSLAFDFINYFDEIPYPDALKRTVYTNLLDRLASGGNTAAAERVHATVSEWVEGQGATLAERIDKAGEEATEQAREAATVYNGRIEAGEGAEGQEKVDVDAEADKAAQRARAGVENDHKGLLAWLLFTGSRIDLRRQDLFRARDRARDALTAYAAAGDAGKQAEVHNHMAGIELQDGNAQAALDAVEKALQAGQVQTPEGKTAVLPNVLATAEQIRGLVARRSGKLDDAIKHFRTANEVAGRVGLAGLALDSGLSYGEALLVGGQTEKGRDALRRVLQIAQSLRNAVRERQAAELLAQAEGALKNYEAALPLAARTLQLSQALKFEHTLPIDLYNLGFFHFMTNKPSEAVSYFTQSEQRIAGLGKHPVVKELHYFKGLAHLRTGDLDAAKTSLRNGLRPMQEAKDWPKMCSALDALANIEERQGNKAVAKKLLTDAIGFAKQANLKEQRKQLKKRLDSIA